MINSDWKSMMDNTVFVKKYDKNETLFPINTKEILRYSGYMGNYSIEDEEVKRILDSVIEENRDIFTYRVCYRRMPLEWEKDKPILPFEHDSKNLAVCLKGSKEVVMFAATVGMDVDRMIARYQRISPVKALFLQAFGAERVECLCDYFCNEIEQEVIKEGLSVTPRFSPGYGDLSLSVQKDMMVLLDCNRQIGISLGESLLMTPSKSVTAIFGIGECVKKQNTAKCQNCSKKNCEFKRLD